MQVWMFCSQMSEARLHLSINGIEGSMRLFPFAIVSARSLRVTMQDRTRKVLCQLSLVIKDTTAWRWKCCMM